MAKNEIDFKPPEKEKGVRPVRKIGKMLQSLFTIFAVTKLTDDELSGYEAHLLHLKHNNFISDIAYNIEMKKVFIAKKIVDLLKDIENLTKNNRY